MKTTEHLIDLPDGGQLSVIEQGSPQGRAVVYLHGSPGSNKDHCHQEALYRELDVRMISVNRPGIGKSSSKEGWNALGFAGDLKTVLDTLGVEKAAVSGFSSGGLHACAFAHQHPERVSKLGLLASVAPFDIPELSESRAEASKQLHDMARDNPDVLLEQFSGVDTPEALLAAIHAIVAPADQAIFERPDIAEQFHLAFADLLPDKLKHVFNEIGMINSPWGFSVTEIKAETHVWHGTADINVPIECCKYLTEQIPSAEAHCIEGAGHYFPFVQWREILQSILDT